MCVGIFSCKFVYDVCLMAGAISDTTKTLTFDAENTYAKQVWCIYRCLLKCWCAHCRTTCKRHDWVEENYFAGASSST